MPKGVMRPGSYFPVCPTNSLVAHFLSSLGLSLTICKMEEVVGGVGWSSGQQIFFLVLNLAF